MICLFRQIVHMFEAIVDRVLIRNSYGEGG